MVLALLVLSSILFGSDFFVQEWWGFQHQRILGTTDERGFERAIVSRIVDGDTIELADGRKVRYIGIDTPETKHPNKEVECFGEEASQYNQDLVLGQEVELEKDVSETDRYGRLLRYVWLNEVLVNKELVVAGYAQASSYPPDIARQAEFQTAQIEAQAESRGLWAACPL